MGELARTESMLGPTDPKGPGDRSAEGVDAQAARGNRPSVHVARSCRHWSLRAITSLVTAITQSSTYPGNRRDLRKIAKVRTVTFMLSNNTRYYCP